MGGIFLSVCAQVVGSLPFGSLSRSGSYEGRDAPAPGVAEHQELESSGFGGTRKGKRHSREWGACSSKRDQATTDKTEEQRIKLRSGRKSPPRNKLSCAEFTTSRKAPVLHEAKSGSRQLPAGKM